MSPEVERVLGVVLVVNGVEFELVGVDGRPRGERQWWGLVDAALAVAGVYAVSQRKCTLFQKRALGWGPTLPSGQRRCSERRCSPGILDVYG